MIDPRELDAARAAKDLLRARLADDPRVNGVGIDTAGGHAGVRINITDPDDAPDVPEEVDGVPVHIVVVGSIQAWRRTDEPPGAGG